MLIFLIGFMGCGKSYIGRHLAPALGYDYVDMDHYIEEQEGIPVKDIFEQKGEAYFREREHAWLQQLSPEQQMVVSTGGGAPCFFDNMDIMNAKGLTIYLNRSKSVVIPRLIKGQHKRPLLANMDETTLEKFYDERLASRVEHYNKARIHAGDAELEDIEDLVRFYLTEKTKE